MEKKNWGIFKSEKTETYEKAINELVNLGLEKVKILSENSEKMAYHGIEHTKQVVELSQQILELLEASSQEKILIKPAASFHDAIQKYRTETITEPPESPFAGLTKKLMRRTSGNNEKGEYVVVENEKESAELGCSEMERINGIRPKTFSEKDKEIFKKSIMATKVIGFEAGTVVNNIDKTEDDNGKKIKYSPIEIALAMADVGTVGIKNPKDYKRDGDLLFIEENIDIREQLEMGNITSKKQREYIRYRILNWSKVQIGFAEGRKKFFEEKEIFLFPENKREKAKKLFCNFDININSAKEIYTQREKMTFDRLIKDVYGEEMISNINKRLN